MTNLTSLFLHLNQIVDISALSGLTNLERLFLDGNEISDIQALVENLGLSEGDHVDLRSNYLDITPGSPDKLDIETLKKRGGDVLFDPQN